jgi:two-component system response regulator DesR
VAVVDYELHDGHGLELCLEYYSRGLRTLVYSAYGQRLLAAAALLAGAGGLIHKSAEPAELCDAIRSVARGIRLYPPVTGEVLDVCARRLPEEDLPILGTLVEGASRADAAEALGLGDGEIDSRLRSMIERLRPATGALVSRPFAA